MESHTIPQTLPRGNTKGSDGNVQQPSFAHPYTGTQTSEDKPSADSIESLRAALRASRHETAQLVSALESEKVNAAFREGMAMCLRVLVLEKTSRLPTLLTRQPLQLTIICTFTRVSLTEALRSEVWCRC